MEQNTPEWHKWRGKGLGASDAPIVMGVSPWKSRFRLWGEKLGKIQPAPAHPFAVSAMERGKLLEPIARTWYEKKSGILMSMEDASVEHPKYPFIRCSLDGHNKEEKGFIEIKSPGKVDHAKAVKGKVPDKYIPQIQQQFLVTGYDWCDYVSFDGKDGVVIRVEPDKDYQKKLLKELIAFWTLVQSQTPPSVDGSDLESLVKDMSKQMEIMNQYMATLTLLTDALALAQAA